MKPTRPHFVIVTYPVASHINPGLHLAHRLISAAPGATVTFSTSASAHRLMFQGRDTSGEVRLGDLTFLPYPDGDRALSNAEAGLASILTDLSARGRHVTCLIHTILLMSGEDAARQLGTPTVQFWVQPATTFAAYHHYFNGYEDVIKSHVSDPRFQVRLPGLPPMDIRDLPSILTKDSTPDGPYSMFLPGFRAGFGKLAGERRSKILVNTFDELEPEALVAVDKLDLIAVGPISPGTDAKTYELDLFKPDEKRYMDWLDGRPEKSVVYVSFGSISVLKKQQMEQILEGLKTSRRPYLWVVRKDCRNELELELEEYGREKDGMVVEWCSQVRVLRHPSIGCFVTHCGWNSTMESLVCGVPTVGVPQWVDQPTNATLLEKMWGCGVRTEVDGDGLLEGKELKRCLDLVMGEGEEGREIRKNAEHWKEKATEAVGEGGSSDRNLKAFVDEITQLGQN